MTTITEALAEIKTIGKRIEKKQQFILDNLFLQGNVKDPLALEGGSPKAVSEAVQSIGDLEQRIVDLRQAIARTNEATLVTVQGVERTIAEWLTWRREVASARGRFMSKLRQQIQHVRQQARERDMTVSDKEGSTDKDLTVFISEKRLADDIELHETILGELDGQLSLANATTAVDNLQDAA